MPDDRAEHTEEIDSELLPDGNDSDVDPISYVEGVLAGVFGVGVVIRLGYGLPADQLMLIGGVGLLAAFAWEFKR